MKRRLPKKIRLPWGWKIAVVQCSKKQMKEMEAEELDGFWLADRKTIFLRSSLPVARKKYILAHEVQHAVTDWMHHFLDEGEVKP